MEDHFLLGIRKIIYYVFKFIFLFIKTFIKCVSVSWLFAFLIIVFPLFYLGRFIFANNSLICEIKDMLYELKYEISNMWNKDFEIHFKIFCLSCCVMTFVLIWCTGLGY